MQRHVPSTMCSSQARTFVACRAVPLRRQTENVHTGWPPCHSTFASAPSWSCSAYTAAGRARTSRSSRRITGPRTAPRRPAFVRRQRPERLVCINWKRRELHAFSRKTNPHLLTDGTLSRSAWLLAASVVTARRAKAPELRMGATRALRGWAKARRTLRDSIVNGGDGIGG
jgi:hypothetical protein